MDRFFPKKRPKYVGEKIMRVILITFLLFCPISSNVTAQNTTGNRNAKCDEIVIRDKSDPVWKALDAEFAKFAEAVRKKDLDAMFAPYAPDFQAKEPNGQVMTREMLFGYLRNGFAQVKETLHTSNTILRLAVCGDEATATVLQQWHRMQIVAGKLRRVETNVVQDLHWVKKPDGWKIRGVDEIKAGAAFLDGRRVDATKPMDPEAPAYDPYDPHPKQPITDALFQLIVDKGIESALQQFNALKRSNDYFVTEIQLNNLGYRLLNTKRIKEAIGIFKLNVETYPQSAGVYDSLGEAYMIKGDKQSAIRNYQRAVELDPQNTNAIEMLKKLRSQ